LRGSCLADEAFDRLRRRETGGRGDGGTAFDRLRRRGRHEYSCPYGRGGEFQDIFDIKQLGFDLAIGQGRLYDPGTSGLLCNPAYLSFAHFFCDHLGIGVLGAGIIGIRYFFGRGAVTYLGAFALYNYVSRTAVRQLRLTITFWAWHDHIRPCAKKQTNYWLQEEKN